MDFMVQCPGQRKVTIHRQLVQRGVCHSEVVLQPHLGKVGWAIYAVNQH